ncbi:hypothetical protein [Ralstonia pseudosolanacearum]|uniref:hypothetical protein n=1 Tax=Ralstonia pseudosolanacearum TaxID=1310165 RepID=UPI0011CEAC16|nr:hypothetical protein [Ralstonia pseudosolanacearum]
MALFPNQMNQASNLIDAGAQLTPSPDDILIWKFGSGAQLTASRNLILPGAERHTFTAGRSYEVVTMHPIYPAHIRVLDDQGALQRLWANHIRCYFES